MRLLAALARTTTVPVSTPVCFSLLTMSRRELEIRAGNRQWAVNPRHELIEPNSVSIKGPLVRVELIY